MAIEHANSYTDDAVELQDIWDASSHVRPSTASANAPHHDVVSIFSDDTEHPTLNPPEHGSVLTRLFRNIMSRTPLLIRSSPAFGTGSYGGIPIIGQRRSSSSIGQDADIQRSTKGKRRSNGIQPVVSAPAGLRGTSRRRERRFSGVSNSLRRSSTNTSDLALGMDAKASFAAGDMVYGSGRPDSIHSDEDSTNSEALEDEDPPDNSPYPEVRASVRATDDTTLSISTPRMWLLSLLFALAGSATNLFFSLRYPAVAITPVIALVLVHPLGRAWDFLLKQGDDPVMKFTNGIGVYEDDGDDVSTRTSLNRFRLFLAQGTWNEKEHTCVYIASNVSFGFAFATDVIVEQHKFYGQDVTIMYQILLTISTQMIGYAFAGLTRRFLVRPAAMIWPGTLMSSAMFSTMHRNENKVANGWTIPRYRFFVIVWACSFGWYFFPGLIMPALSYFSVITWFFPQSVVVSNLVSMVSRA